MMTIDGPRTAREFVRAWASHAGAPRAYRTAAESQRACAALSGPNREQARRHLAAAEILDHAAGGTAR